MVDVEALGATMERLGFMGVDPREESIAGVPARIVTATVPSSPE